MRFFERKRRQPPAVIIVPLIDILMVLLVFMMATSTFKVQPAIRLTLPESRQAKEGALAEKSVLVSVAPTEPHFFFQQEAVSLEELEVRLRELARQDPDTAITLQLDTDAPWGKVVAAMDAIKAAGFNRPISALTRRPSGSP